MSTFADSSALVKLYVDELDHEAVRGLTDVVVSQLARVEIPAAIWRKVRTRDLRPALAAVVVAEFEADWFGDGTAPPRFAVVAVAPAVLDEAARVAGIHGLRAYDAVQLASARAAAAADPDLDTFAAFDTSLRRAAAAEGLTPFP